MRRRHISARLPGYPPVYALSRGLSVLDCVVHISDFSEQMSQVASTGSFLVTHGFFACKFRKAFNGKLPPPTNKTQLRYYNANSGLSIWPTLPGWEQLRTFPSGGTVNLLVYYDLDPQHELAWVKIACPRCATLTEVECLWDKPIDNPLFSGSGGFEVKHSTEEREDLPFEDLPFEEDDDSPLTGLAE